MFCLTNENSFYFYSKTIKLAEAKSLFRGYSVNGTLKYDDVLKNNVMKTFILASTNRMQTKHGLFLFANEINRYMVPYNMITLANETINKAKHLEDQETMLRNFSFYFFKKNSTLRDDIGLFNQNTYYEYFLDYSTIEYPAFYGCYNNVFVTDNFHEEFDSYSDLDWIRTLYKGNLTEGIDYVMRNHIDRIVDRDYNTFLIQNDHMREILVNIQRIIFWIIDDLYKNIEIKYDFNYDAYFLQYKNYSKSYNDDEEDENYDDSDDEYDEDYDEYNDEEYGESDDNIYTSYHVDSYLNFILDKNRGDFILDLSFTYYLQYSGLDIETYSYSLFELKIKLMRDRKDIKFSIHININADEIYNKSDLLVIYKQKNKEIVNVFCDYEKDIKEGQFVDFHSFDANQDSKYLTQLNEIDKLVSEIVPKKININFNMIVS